MSLLDDRTTSLLVFFLLLLACLFQFLQFLPGDGLELLGQRADFVIGNLGTGFPEDSNVVLDFLGLVRQADVVLAVAGVGQDFLVGVEHGPGGDAALRAVFLVHFLAAGVLGDVYVDND